MLGRQRTCASESHNRPSLTAHSMKSNCVCGFTTVLSSKSGQKQIQLRKSPGEMREGERKRERENELSGMCMLLVAVGVMFDRSNVCTNYCQCNDDLTANGILKQTPDHQYTFDHRENGRRTCYVYFSNSKWMHIHTSRHSLTHTQEEEATHL